MNHERMSPDFTRYSCQLALPGFNEKMQQRLQNAKVLIAGAGGLGCPAALYLTASGMGTIGIADYDTVSVSNLHRQVLFNAAEVGLKKAQVACAKLQQQNPGISLIPHDIKIEAGNVMELIASYDIVLDCTDNFDAKYLLNDACVLTGKPLVYGAIYQYEGQVAVWNVVNDDGTYSPNYRDIFKEVNAVSVPNCAEGGVMPTLAGIIGCMQANEVMKFFSRDGEIMAGKLLMFDVRSMQSRIIATGKVSKVKITSLPEMIAVPGITIEELHASEKDRYELIDVRSPGEHHSFNIGGTNIPVTEIEKNMGQINFEKPVLLYCETGKRSSEAVKLIKRKLPTVNIFSLEGGLRAAGKANAG